MKAYTFKTAVPVWEEGKDKEMNYHLAFRAVVSKAENLRVCVSASNLYQMYIDGEMIAEGPARAGHNHYRVDELDITKHVKKDNTVVAFYVASYYVKNFYLPRHPGFFCAEIIADDVVVAATGHTGFTAMHHTARIQKTDRFSFQRPFAEAYRYTPCDRDFLTEPSFAFSPVKLCPTEAKKFITRHVPYPCYDDFSVKQIVGTGTFVYHPTCKEPQINRWLHICPESVVPGFPRAEAEVYVMDEMDKCACTLTDTVAVCADHATLAPMHFSIFDLGSEKTGFIRLKVTCDKQTELIVSFDELLWEGDISTCRYGLTNGLVLYLAPGSYEFVAMEASAMRYIKLANKSEGTLTVSYVGIREFAFDYHDEGLGSQNEALNRIYAAAVETFRQNTLDIYMDCPTRERAGWLCDSYFTSKVEHFLTGKSLVERNFLENFIMAENMNDIPSDMFPMCYPADFVDHDFIPNWAMWYVIELGEYLDRTGDREMVDYAKDKVMALYRYFTRLKNDDGLLENLENWVFVEWSKANEFVQNVNYPSNMLYTLMLRTMGKLYDESFTHEADAMAETIVKQSFYDGFFHDHAVRREDGTLQVMDADISETCQYYAFFTEIATLESHPALWETLLNDFGPDRAEKGLWKEIYPSNAFIGNYLRLSLLERHGKIDALLQNIEGYFDYMAQRTGTLWEIITPTASCNHGFSSLVAVWLKKHAK